MDVLIVAQYFPPDLGGAATRAYNIAKGLSLNGCNVTVVTAFPHYPHGNIPKDYKHKILHVEVDDRIRLIRTYMPPIKSEGFFKRLVLRFTFAITALFALPLIGKVDAVWASSWSPGYFYSKIKCKPLALNVDDLTLEDLVDLKVLKQTSFSYKIGSTFYRLFYVKPCILTPISVGYFDIMIKKYRVQPNRINLVRGGVDLSIFKKNSLMVSQKSSFIVLYSGAFSIAYNFEQIIQASKIIQFIDPEIKFIIQGAGELLKDMQNSLEKSKVKNVKIIDKIFSRDEVAKLLASADVLILPLSAYFGSCSPYRGMSSKLYEYQAVGKPIICCSEGVPADYIKETRSGLVVSPNDIDGLVKAILKLKQNSVLCQEFGRNGRSYVENEASIEAIGGKLKSILEKLGSK